MPSLDHRRRLRHVPNGVFFFFLCLDRGFLVLSIGCKVGVLSMLRERQHIGHKLVLLAFVCLWVLETLGILSVPFVGRERNALAGALGRIRPSGWAESWPFR